MQSLLRMKGAMERLLMFLMMICIAGIKKQKLSQPMLGDLVN